MSTTPQLKPLVSANVALFSVAEDCLQVLLVQRGRDPAKGCWALPGAVLNPDVDADLEATAIRALHDKISVDVAHLEQVTAVSGRSRDPRGFSVAVVFLALLPRDRIQAIVRSKVDAAQWVSASKLSVKLAFDHEALLASAVAALRDKVGRHALPLQLLSEKFTLTELQRACEAVLGQTLDKGGFRRRLRTSEDLEEIPGEFVLGPQRPAQLYRARHGFRF